MCQTKNTAAEADDLLETHHAAKKKEGGGGGGLFCFSHLMLRARPAGLVCGGVLVVGSRLFVVPAIDAKAQKQRNRPVSTSE